MIIIITIKPHTSILMCNQISCLGLFKQVCHFHNNFTFFFVANKIFVERISVSFIFFSLGATA